MIHHHDEAELQRAIVTKLNQNGYHFEITPVDFDAKDVGNGMYLEVKRDDLAAAQLLYAIAKVDVEPTFLLLANANELRVYKGPSRTDIVTFAKTIDPTLAMSPSSVNSADATTRAMELLGDHVTIWDYSGPFTVYDKKQELFITKDNFSIVESVLSKYTINPLQFVKYIATVYTSNQKIVVNHSGKIINIDTGEFFTQPSGESLPIKNIHDKQLIECLRVRAKDVKDILRADGANETIQERRQGGRFFTKDTIAKTVTDIVDGLKPEYIVEPYVGAGSLIEGLVGKYHGSANDINKDDIDVLRRQYEGLPWKFTNLDMFVTPTDELIDKMGIPRDKMVAFVTNPPFGSSSTSTTRLITSDDERQPNAKARKISIDYGDLGDVYGRGDIILPAIGRMVEMLTVLGNGYLIIFSQFGVFCGRDRYVKLFKSLLKDFEFIEGHVFNGDEFEGTSKRKPVAFTVWKYHHDANTSLDDVWFLYGDLPLKLKRMVLLKDGWNYGSLIDNYEISVKPSERFMSPFIRTFGSPTDITKGCAQIVPDNVKIDANVPNVPSELVYALWSLVVGSHSLSNGDQPLPFDNAYVHLPDFTRTETMEIIAYAALHELLVQVIYNRCGDDASGSPRVGFVGMSRVFRFGNEKLTIAAKWLIDTYGYCQLGDRTIREVYEYVKSNPTFDNKERLQIGVLERAEIEKRLRNIGYWDYLPIPMDF